MGISFISHNSDFHRLQQTMYWTTKGISLTSRGVPPGQYGQYLASPLGILPLSSSVELSSHAPSHPSCSTFGNSLSRFFLILFLICGGKSAATQFLEVFGGEGSDDSFSHSGCGGLRIRSSCGCTVGEFDKSSAVEERTISGGVVAILLD